VQDGFKLTCLYESHLQELSYSIFSHRRHLFTLTFVVKYVVNIICTKMKMDYFMSVYVLQPVVTAVFVVLAYVT